MKKRLSAIICFTLAAALLLCGCAEVEVTTSSTRLTTTTTVTTTRQSERNDISVKNVIVRVDTYEESSAGDQPFEICCRTPSVILSGVDGDETGLNAVFIDLRQQFFAKCTELRQIAAEQGAFFSADRKVTVTRADELIVCVTMEDVFTLGSDHERDRKTVALYVQTAEAWEPDIPALNESLKAIADREWLDKGWREIIDEMSDASRWYLSVKGAVYTAPAGEIAAESLGVLRFTVPYTDPALSQIAPEKTAGGGDMLVSAGQVMGKGKRVYRLQTDVSGMKFCLYTQSEVYDVSVSEVRYAGYMQDRSGLIAESTIWYAWKLSDSELLEVVSSIPDTIPNMMISYRNEGEIQKLVVKGTDASSVALTDMESGLFEPLDATYAMPKLCDVNADGEEEYIDLARTEGGTGFSLYVVESGNTSVIRDTRIDTDPRVWLADVDGDGMIEMFLFGLNADNELMCYCWHYVKGAGLVNAPFPDGKEGGWSSGGILSIGQAGVNNVELYDVFGPYGIEVTRNMALGPDGFTPVSTEAWSFSSSEYRTIMAPVAAVVDGQNVILTEGTVQLTSTDGVSRVYFTTDSMASGYFELIRDQDGWSVRSDEGLIPYTSALIR